MAGFLRVVQQVLVIGEFFKILIDVVKVGVEDLCNVIQLATNTGGSLCLMCSRGVGCGLYICSSALEQSYVAGFETFGLVQGRLSLLVVVAVIELAGSGIPRCLRRGSDFVQGLCLRSIVVEIAVVDYGSLPLNYCQWME